MICPSCQNRGFKPTIDVNKPLKVLATFKHDIVNERQIICLQCGASWITSETFERIVEKEKTISQTPVLKNSSKISLF